MRQDVEAGCLAALLVLDRNLERVPEPFRMQPMVELFINYEEYIKFIQTIPADSNLLYSPTSKLQDSISTLGTQSLIKAFYVDMALAVGKELFFAESQRKAATVIRHDFYGCRDRKLVSILPDTPQLLRLILSNKGFPLPLPVSTVNQKHWNYACRLLQDATQGPTKWVDN